MYPIPIFDIFFPFPVTKSQSQLLKFHFRRAKTGQYQFPFYPFCLQDPLERILVTHSVLRTSRLRCPPFLALFFSQRIEILLHPASYCNLPLSNSTFRFLSKFEFPSKKKRKRKKLQTNEYVHLPKRRS